MTAAVEVVVVVVVGMESVGTNGDVERPRCAGAGAATCCCCCMLGEEVKGE